MCDVWAGVCVGVCVGDIMNLGLHTCTVNTCKNN